MLIFAIGASTLPVISAAIKSDCEDDEKPALLLEPLSAK